MLDSADRTMRPLLAEVPSPPRPPLLVRARRFFLERWPGRIVAAALLLWLLELPLALVGWQLPAPVAVPASAVRWLFLAWLLVRAMRLVADRLLWRIRTKLLVSYLFIALVPVVLLSLFMVVAGILLLGFTAAREVTRELDRQLDVMQTAARTGLAGLPASDAAAAAELPARISPARELHEAVSYTLLRGGRVAASSGGAPAALPAWLEAADFRGLTSLERAAGEPPVFALRAVRREGQSALVLELPVDASFLAGIEKRTSVHVLDPIAVQTEGDEPSGGTRTEIGRRRRGVRVEVGGRRVEGQRDSGLMFVALPDLTDWRTGERGPSPWPIQYQPLTIVKQLAPMQLARDAGGRTMPELLLYALGIVGGIFVLMYAIALALGLVLARSITRGVHELSVGTQKLREGDFSHVIRAHSRDQLGDLAGSFNLMSRGIQRLMQEQAEKERLEEELRIARKIQMSLLPGATPASVPGVRIAALCLPAAEVGGDYYDLLPLGPTRMGLLVADVSGKGTSAALYMAELKGLVLSLSRIYESPARLLSEANRILSANMDSRSFVTMTYAVVDTVARRMRHARAGHNPIIHLQARTNRSALLAPAGLGLGLDPGARFDAILEEAEVALEPGDLFLFFTDGLSEAMNPSAELFGEGRLRRILEESGSLGSEELRERILDEVRRFVGDALPHDDMTLVVLKVVSEEGGR